MGGTKPRSLVRETDVVVALRRLFTAIGATVYVIGEGKATRHSHSRQTPGIPDLYVIHPTKGVWWWEAKTPDGRLSEAQKQFRDRCKAARGVTWRSGGVQEAYTFLWAQGILAGGETLADTLDVLQRATAPVKL
jgi:hypothetical protein